VLIATFVVMVLIATLFPGPSPWRNGIRWLDPGPGLHFKGIAQALSDAPIVSTTGEFTVEVFLVKGFIAGKGNQEIISFYDDQLIRPLLIGQFPHGFILRGRADNPSGDARRDYYVGLGELGLTSPDALQHLAVTAGEKGARLHVNGRATPLTLPRTIPGLGEAFGGRLMLGSSNTGWRAWLGKIKGIAIWNRILKASDLQDHARFPERVYDDRLLSDESLLALYRLDEGQGRRTRSARPGAPELFFPDRLIRPTRPNFLSFYTFDPADRVWWPRDVLLNFLAFAPFGFVIAWRRPKRALMMALVWGIAFSLGIEVIQSFIPGRSSSLLDLASNGFGSLVGALGTRLGPVR